MAVWLKKNDDCNSFPVMAPSLAERRIFGTLIRLVSLVLGPDKCIMKGGLVLLINVCLAGGLIYAGLKTLIKRQPRKKMTWLVKLDGEPARGLVSETDVYPQDMSAMTAAHYLTMSSVSLGLSVSGALFYPPLSLVSVPLTVYTTVPIFERAYVALFIEGRIRLALVQSATIVGTLVSRHYTLASLVPWLHYYLMLLTGQLQHFGDLMWSDLASDYKQFLTRIHGAKPQAVWVQAHGVGMEIPFADLHVGDVVVANPGDVIPVEGVIVEGKAEVSQWLAAGFPRLLIKGVGDRIAPATLVLTGKLCLRVENLA